MMVVIISRPVLVPLDLLVNLLQRHRTVIGILDDAGFLLRTEAVSLRIGLVVETFRAT